MSCDITYSPRFARELINFLKYGVVRAGYHFGDKDKGVGNYGTLGCGINFWPIRADFSYALADKDCFMRRTWQLGVGIVF